VRSPTRKKKKLKRRFSLSMSMRLKRSKKSKRLRDLTQLYSRNSLTKMPWNSMMGCFLMRELAKIMTSLDMKTRYWVVALPIDGAQAHTEGLTPTE
jgi:hypothetical protein